MAAEKYYKVLNKDGSCCHGGKGKWYLPKNGKPGKWMPKIKGKLVECENGYHICKIDQLVVWLGAAIYEVECDDELLVCSDKYVARRCRLVKKTAWKISDAPKYAADCAERVLHVFEEWNPKDLRPRKALELARKPVRNITYEDLTAPQFAAREARKVDKWAAGSAADSIGATLYAVVHLSTGSHTFYATYAAVEAAQKAGGKNERKWQVNRLLEYLVGKA